MSFSYSAKATLRENPGFLTPLIPAAGHRQGGCATLIKQRKRNRYLRLYLASGFTSRKARPAALIPATPVETKRPHMKFCLDLLYNKD